MEPANTASARMQGLLQYMTWRWNRGGDTAGAWLERAAPEDALGPGQLISRQIRLHEPTRFTQSATRDDVDVEGLQKVL